MRNANVLDDSGEVINTIVLDDDANPADWNAVWVEDDVDLELEVRKKRDRLLAESDVYALADRALSESMLNYRQSLRDITSQKGFPDSVEWPVNPEAKPTEMSQN